MKRLLYSLTAFIFSMNIVQAKHIDAATAELVAKNFTRQNPNPAMRSANFDLTLAHTETSASGIADYYVFGFNGSVGFVIVSAEDARKPILGYSTESNFVAPSETVNPNFNYWMNKRKTEIEYLRANNVQANAEVATEWTDYVNNKLSAPKAMSTAHLPLVQTKWDQLNGSVSGSATYNNLCPGGSVTGCVATTMAQIMKYWKFPAHGTGSHSYSDSIYGNLTVNFASSTYNWTNMPLTSSNSDVAKIMYDAGVSVEMRYSPASSGSHVCGLISAEHSFPTYFGYDPNIHCELQDNYAPSYWIQMLEDEFTAGRPVQYQGIDPTNGGHSWVCDGNDASDMMHMNWGWSGTCDAYYDITNLATNDGKYVFSTYDYGLMGIQPLGYTGIATQNSRAGFGIYPNPVSSFVTIDGVTNSDKVHYSLYNMLGSEIKSGDVAANGTSFNGKIQMSDVSSGMYFLKVSDETGSFTKKLNKE